MNENKLDEIIAGLSSDGLDAIDNLFKDTENPNGIQLLGVLFALDDNDFEILRPLLQDTMIEAYNEPQTQMQLIQAFAQAGISVNDIVNNSDKIIERLFEEEKVELSESKKDFFKFMFASMSNAISTSTLNPAHTVEIPVEICRENAKLPTYTTNGSGAMDIYSPEEYTIECGQTIIIPIGIKVAIPHGYALLIQPRSGMSARMKVRIPNSPGLIDEDYHEEIGVIIENTDILVKDVDIDYVTNNLGTGTVPTTVKEYGSPIIIGKGERFAQMRLVEVPRVKWREVGSLGTQIEDHGKGFGSTGVK